MGKIPRAALFVFMALVLLYAGDYVSARFRLPNGRQTLGSVDVQVMWAIKQKDGRIDYELGDSETQPCLHALFPHLGYTPCWYLTRHKNQVIKVGSASPHRVPLRYPVNSCRFPMFRFSWKWRRRSPRKVMERTHEEATEARYAG